MKLNFIRLQNFRNIEFADVEFDEACVWIYGNNAQGKTNLLEAVGLLNALRSFRTSATDTLIKSGEKQANLLASTQSQQHGECVVELSLGQTKTISIDGEKVTKLADFLGKFPTLAITNEDVKLLRGSPEIRRKDMDMFISSIDAQYFESLRRYHRALVQRNALLRENSRDKSLFEAFEFDMAEHATNVLQKRKIYLDELANIASEKYATLSAESLEQAAIKLKPNCEANSQEDFQRLFRENRESDIEKRTTQKGVHRDDFKIKIDDKDAKLYASEGQQKSGAIAIRLAQFDMLKKYLANEPVMLCDDILGELDASRRERFWASTSPTAQIIATATEPPTNATKHWKIINAKNGNFAYES